MKFFATSIEDRYKRPKDKYDLESYESLLEREVAIQKILIEIDQKLRKPGLSLKKQVDLLTRDRDLTDDLYYEVRSKLEEYYHLIRSLRKEQDKCPLMAGFLNHIDSGKK